MVEKGVGTTANLMEKEFFFIRTVVFMRDILKMVYLKARDDSLIQTVILM
jgi:hypothetical protein